MYFKGRRDKYIYVLGERESNRKKFLKYLEIF